MGGEFRWWVLDRPRTKKRRCASLLHRLIYEGEDSGLTLNTYVGCAHRCVYCYAAYEFVPEFYDVVEAKINAPEVLSLEGIQAELRRSGTVFLSSATDCYQPAEKNYQLTRRCVEILQRIGASYMILTKSVGILRDLELHAAYRDRCMIAWSLTTLDEEIKRMLEPYAPSASSVLSAVRAFSRRGVKVGVNIDPIIPGLTDDPSMIERLVREVSKAGALYISAGVLRLRDDIWARLRGLLESREMHSAVERIREVYFKRPRKQAYYYVADPRYAEGVLTHIARLAKREELAFGFPKMMSIPCSNSDKRAIQLRLDGGYFRSVYRVAAHEEGRAPSTTSTLIIEP